MKIGLILSVCLSVLLSAAARADEEEVVRRLSGAHFANDQWYFQPVHNPESGLVDAIVAIAKPEATIGDNLNTVMFIREGNEFEAWSWRNTSQSRAVYSAKVILNVSDEDDVNWLLEDELPWWDENAIRPPIPYLAGMLTDDQLFEAVMESNNPEALVSALAQLGYPVAALRPGGGGESTPPCEEVAELRPMLDVTEWYIQHGPFDSQTIGAFFPTVRSLLRSCSDGCTPHTTPWAEFDTEECGWTLDPTAIAEYLSTGVRYHCTYIGEKKIVRTRTRNVTLADCTTYGEAECSKIRIPIETRVCTNFVPSGNPDLPKCLQGPSCGTSLSTGCFKARKPTPWPGIFGPLPCPL